MHDGQRRPVEPRMSVGADPRDARAQAQCRSCRRRVPERDQDTLRRRGQGRPVPAAEEDRSSRSIETLTARFNPSRSMSAGHWGSARSWSPSRPTSWTGRRASRSSCRSRRCGPCRRPRGSNSAHLGAAPLDVRSHDAAQWAASYSLPERNPRGPKRCPYSSSCATCPIEAPKSGQA